MTNVFVRVDRDSNIVEVASDAFVRDFTGWVQIAQGVGDRFTHAQNNYFDRPIVNNDGIPVFRLVDGKPVLRDDVPDVAENAVGFTERFARIERAMGVIAEYLSKFGVKLE